MFSHMTSRRQFSVTLPPALFSEANSAAEARNVSLDQFVEQAIEALLELEDDARTRELIRIRDKDPEIEVSLDDLVAGISDTNIHGEND